MKKRESVEKRIVTRLQGFVDVLRSGEPIEEHYDCRKVVLDLEPTLYRPAAVKATRRLLRASQGVFAQFIGVSVKAVRSWEQGSQTPSDMASRFMDEIQRNPEYWRNRLRESVRFKQAGRRVANAKARS